MERAYIINTKLGIKVEIPIISKKTILIGDGSTGKSFLYEELTRRDNKGSIAIDYSAGKVLCVDKMSDLENVQDNTLIVSDEIFINVNRSILSELLKISNPFMLICRKLEFAGETDIRSIFHLSFDGSVSSVRPFLNLNIVSMPTGKYTHIICESSESKSEYLILSELLNLNKNIDIIAASGNNKIFGSIRHVINTCKNPRILLFADLAAFSSSALFISSRVPSNIYELYDYPSFEALLLFSRIVQSLRKDINKNYFSRQTLETFYEKELEKITKGTKFEYKHRPSKLSKCFYEACGSCCFFDDPNTIGKVLFNKYGIGLMAWYYANYTQFLETYDYLIEDKSKIPEEQALDILNSIKDIYLGDLHYKCFDD